MVSQMSNLALELALARALSKQPTLCPTASTPSTSTSLAEAVLLSRLPADLLLRDSLAASLLTTHCPLIGTGGSEAMARTDEDRLGMMLKKYRR